MNGVFDMNENGKSARQKRKLKKKKKQRSFLAFLITAFVLYLVVNVLMSFGNRIETMIVRRGTEEEHITAEGYIFREQTVISAPENGYLRCEADEEQRVKIGETVAYVYQKEIDPSVSSELEAIEKKIAKLSSQTAQEDIYSSDATKIEQSIARNMRRVPALGFENRPEEIAEIRDEVERLIKGRKVVKGETVEDDSDNELESLKARKTELESDHGIDRTAVAAPTAGAFTTSVDGLEEALVLEKLEGITPAYFKELNKMKPKTSATDKVSSGNPVGKIVNNYKWYVAIPVPESLAEDIDEGDAVELRFPDIDIRTISGTVTYVSGEEGGKVAVVIKSNKYVDMIYSSSKVKVELITHHYEGLKIPSESVRIVDQKTGVYVVRNDKARFFPVNILYNSKKWVIISESLPEGGTTIKLYDELIVDGKNLYDSKVVR